MNKTQKFLVDKIISAYEGDCIAEQEAWVRCTAASARKRGFSKAAIKDIRGRYDAAEELFMLCRENGNIELMETARSLMSAYYAVLQAVTGFASVPEYGLEAHVQRLVTA